MSFNRQASVLQIIQDACGQLGLTVPSAAFSAVNDKTATQMVAFLNKVGRRLMKPVAGRRWQVLQRVWEFDTVPGQTEYDLPEDWDSFIDSTAWNATTRLPMVGPATPQQWSYITARALGASTLAIIYRTNRGQFQIYNSPSSAQSLAIDYTSRGWLVTSGTEAYHDTVEADGDTVLLDRELVTSALKLEFLRAKGFDTNVAQAEYNEAEEAALNAEQDAPVLNIGACPQFPLITPSYNLPDTGYGG